jgi:hypothetical protein
MPELPENGAAASRPTTGKFRGFSSMAGEVDARSEAGWSHGSAADAKRKSYMCGAIWATTTQEEQEGTTNLELLEMDVMVILKPPDSGLEKYRADIEAGKNVPSIGFKLGTPTTNQPRHILETRKELVRIGATAGYQHFIESLDVTLCRNLVLHERACAITEIIARWSKDPKMKDKCNLAKNYLAKAQRVCEAILKGLVTLVEPHTGKKTIYGTPLMTLVQT